MWNLPVFDQKLFLQNLHPGSRFHTRFLSSFFPVPTTQLQTSAAKYCSSVHLAHGGRLSCGDQFFFALNWFSCFWMQQLIQNSIPCISQQHKFTHIFYSFKKQLGKLRTEKSIWGPSSSSSSSNTTVHRLLGSCTKGLPGLLSPFF